MSFTNRWQPWVALTAAILLLDVSVTFRNVWPTPAVTWRGELSVELAAGVLLLAAARRWLGAPTPAMLAAMTITWMALVIGHYADVTSSALFGRDINLYWDLPFVPDVVSMFVDVAPIWLVLAAVVALALVFGVQAVIIRWALGRVTRAMDDRRTRQVLAGLSAAALVVFAVQPVRDYETPLLSFGTPVSAVYARQAGVALKAVGGTVSVPPSPAMDSDLSRARGADVLLIFLESYGATSYDRPAFADALASSRADLDAAIRTTGREVVSAYVESPTFGGSSWLAHISLLSGIEVRDPGTNALLMAEKRDTLVTAFSRLGYRTIALMPGLWSPWPEGAFYGFDEIYGGLRLDYRGPTFGWFDIPDQYALAKLDVLEPARAGQPTFAFFPTISTHTPFHPTPPYQPDWTRILTPDPYDADELRAVFERQPDWADLGPSYVDAVAYSYATLAGYLRARADRDLVMVVLGDHQPPALVTGEGAPWDVPVHVIASRAGVLERLRAGGFTSGLTPARPGLGPMHTLLPVLLGALGDPQGESVAAQRVGVAR